MLKDLAEPRAKNTKREPGQKDERVQLKNSNNVDMVKL